VVRCGPVVVRCGSLWCVVVRCGSLWSVVVISHTVLCHIVDVNKVDVYFVWLVKGFILESFIHLIVLNR